MAMHIKIKFNIYWEFETYYHCSTTTMFQKEYIGDYEICMWVLLFYKVTRKDIYPWPYISHIRLRAVKSIYMENDQADLSFKANA